jgi:FkbM family methyltransferase
MITKHLALRYLPDRLLKVARSVHYRNSLKHYDIDAEPDLHACRSLLKEGDTVLDVGANIGVYTRFCSEFVGPSGRVISLEPVPETYSYLTGNVRALNLKNVQCFNVAASDHDDESGRMSIPQYDTGGRNLYTAKLSSEGNVAVKVARLDTLFPDLTPAFIKCDVEGHEVACIKGALNLIRRCQPSWLVEVSSQETFELLFSLKYAAFSYEENTFRPYDSSRPSANYFFFPAR